MPVLSFVMKWVAGLGRFAELSLKKAQSMLVRPDQRPPPGRIMLKTITKNMFDVIACLTIIVSVFYLAAITHILPLPESALTHLSGFASNVMDVLFACGSWVIRHLVD